MSDSPAAHDQLAFQAEVGRLLDLMVHSVYSDKEIFLRELISNAADACDRLRYAAISAPELLADDGEFRISVTVDKDARRISIADNGIGMDRDDMIQNLGTIARSGTAAFAEALTGDARQDANLIGRFGVGFYSAFMVADQVEVLSRKAGTADAWVWQSEGRGTFSVGPAEKAERGTVVTLHVRDGDDEFLDVERLRRIVKTWSDHIPVPVTVAATGSVPGEAVNAASALWTRPRNGITPEQYTAFYRDVGHAFDEPWLTLHWRAEGKIEYTGLLFVPRQRPFDLFHPDRRPAVKLYVKRVFVADAGSDVVPCWLRFLRGVVDNEDLPLNISREMLQKSPVLKAVRTGVTRRVLNELKAKAEKEPEAYAQFWDAFGAVLKEGLYEDEAWRDDLLALARFRSTAGDKLASLADYVGRMRPGQKAIYYISGDDAAAVARSPHLEGFVAKGVEVLLLADPVDDFWIARIGACQGHPLRSVTRAGDDLAGIEGSTNGEDARPEPADLKALIALLKLKLADAVKDVRASERLTESPCCLVADESDLDLHLERLLRMHGQTQQASKRILELNPRHPLVRRLARAPGEMPGELIEDTAHLLLDQARIVDGEMPADPVAFAGRLTRVMQASLPGAA